MTGRGTRSIAALAAIALCAGALSACGGSDSNSAPSSASTSSTGSEKSGGQDGGGTGEQEQASGGGTKQGANDGGESHGSASTSPLQVSGGGSGQYRVKGGDNSVQEFGEESSESELEEAAAALHGFFVARAEEDWRAACALLSKTVAQQLQQLGARTESGGKSCAAILAALTPPLPPAVQRESTVVDAGSLRVEGERGFLIYRGAERTVYAINMAHEDEGWKVGSLAPVPLQ